MRNPLVSIIIPTYNRPHLLPRAVKSALEQTVEDFEVVVVDDASPQPVSLPEHPRLRILRQVVNQGGAAARNAGIKAARGQWITFVDDDDEMLPHLVAVSLAAVEKTDLPKPVGVLSGIEVVNADGRVTDTRLPPTLAKGKHFCLEPIAPGQSFFTKQTLVVEREVLLGLGGFDESFSSRVHTELFLRLNQVCSLLGVPVVTYRLFSHSSPRVSRNPSLRQKNFNTLIHKHESLFKAHPKMFAHFVYEHARKSYETGQTAAAVSHILWAMRIHPRYTLARVTQQFRK
ncbi:glycosyltransferase family 2 protein [Chroogloeocystis siderophila]|jgi:glycosyltransferase involved in cell wall biosynthesis|uniref:Glycosyl transferase family 2 n=1 Tax=Chroogloeocystis siderophila 5.2 s.c.1 TaxID=247279 RepID=A0A1U7HWS9_9CHRO|nr:glycosyltransferase family 2 protein [Chroogloeocystis siderophila]OKH28038.1 glycosyl transferase family 2 [Chroogloeocystis siderophila 5.2 s.c.1]